MLTIRVDGNDALAVRSAVQAAKAKAISEQRPVLIEAMTYRVGHHSTSDDSSAYRSKQAVENWKNMDNPLHRMRNFLTERGWWNDKLEEETKAKHRKTVIEAMGRAEKKKRPSLSSLFEGTYRGELPGNLKVSQPSHRFESTLDERADRFSVTLIAAMTTGTTLGTS